jgi:hypothetical protein
VTPYRLSFTFGGLLIPESRVIADIYMRFRDWGMVRKEVLEKNLLEKTRRESAFRYFREIRDRLKGAFDWELPIISGHDGTVDEARLVLFAVTVRYYRIVREFVVDVIRYKISGGDHRMLGFEFESFWERKAEGAPEMPNVTEASRKKLVQVAYRMLHEAGILSGGRNGTIVPPTVPYGLSTSYAVEQDSDTLLAFLLPDRDIKKLLSEGAG